jgi:hypothetical protein
LRRLTRILEDIRTVHAIMRLDINPSSAAGITYRMASEEPGSNVVISFCGATLRNITKEHVYVHHPFNHLEEPGLTFLMFPIS